MSELAINQYGESFAPPPDTAHWLVRRMNDNKHGGPMQTFGANGRPITLPASASMADFQAALRGHGCAAGRYRLDPLDAQGRPLKGAPVAYLPYPPDRSAPVTEAAEPPRNSNQAAPAPSPWAAPAPVAPAAWSTGGAFPLPAPASLLGAEYLLGEALRAQTAMLAIVAQTNAQISAQQSSLLSAAAELVRAADGAKLPARKPIAMPPPPQVIVQPVPTPTYDEFEDDDEPEAPPPVWQQKVGEVVDQLLPVAKMVIGHKMADMMGGGAADSTPSVDMAASAPRNAGDAAAPQQVEVADPEVEQIDFSPAAWSHLATVVRKLGPAWKTRIDAQLARMSPDERRDFVCSLVSLKMPTACDHVVAAVSVAEQRQTRTAVVGAAATTPDGEFNPTPTAGPAVQATIREMVADAMGGDSTSAASDDGAPPHAAVGSSPLAGLYDTLANEDSVISPALRRIPGGGAMVEAAAETLLGPDGVAELNAAIAAVPDVSGPPLPRPAGASLSDPNVMLRLTEVLGQLAPTEQVTAQTIARRLPLPERNALLDRLMNVSVPEAVAIVRDAVAKYDTHGRPFG